MVRKVDQNRALSPFWDSIGQGPVSGAQVSRYYSEHLSERDFQPVKNFIIIHAVDKMPALSDGQQTFMEMSQPAIRPQGKLLLAWNGAHRVVTNFFLEDQKTSLNGRLRKLSHWALNQPATVKVMLKFSVDGKGFELAMKSYRELMFVIVFCSLQLHPNSWN